MIGGGGEGVWKGGGADLLLIWNISEYLAPPFTPPIHCIQGLLMGPGEGEGVYSIVTGFKRVRTILFFSLT